MDQTQFTTVTPTWWLNGEMVTIAASELRKDLGASLGCEREQQWYLEEVRLQQLFQELQNRRPLLLTQIDEATTDERRLAWLQEAVAAFKPAPADPGKTTAAPGGTTAVDSVTKNQPAPAPAQPKPSAFGGARRAEAQATQAAQTAQTAANTGAPSRAPTTEPAKPSPFAAKRARPASAAAAETAETVETVEITEELQPVVDDLAAAVANAVAAVPGAESLSPEELNQLVSEVLAER